LHHLCVQALSHFHAAVCRQYGAVFVDVHQGASLTQKLQAKARAELRRDDRKTAADEFVGTVQKVSREETMR
jgi:hypothetical protein